MPIGMRIPVVWTAVEIAIVITKVAASTVAWASPPFHYFPATQTRAPTSGFSHSTCSCRRSVERQRPSKIRLEEELGAAAEEKWDAEYFSPAKINLFLRILGKRQDGFHDLASLFQTVGFGDRLFFQKLEEGAGSDIFDCNMDGVPTDKSNLVIRSLDLFREKTGSQQFYKVYLNKSIPAQAGLGGGSGNAATALFAANELCGRPATADDLVLWSADLGSDITFFLSSGTCYCTGRGEILHPQEALPEEKVWLVKPNGGLSTPTVFKNLDYELLSNEDPLELLQNLASFGLDGAKLINDLEPPAFKAMPSLSEMKMALQAQGFKHVLMSGSGSTIFCLGNPSQPNLGWAQSFADKWGVTVHETKFINRCEPANWYVEY